jgi:hypothetical protein
MSHAENDRLVAQNVNFTAVVAQLKSFKALQRIGCENKI